MTRIIKKWGVLLCVAAVSLAACQPVQNEQVPVSNGMVLTGDMEGKAFTIAPGNEDEIFMDMVEAFNQMDAEALWANSADTIIFHQSDGTSGPLTQADMAGLFSTIDSLSWDIHAVVPIKIVGDNRVNVLSDGIEKMYMKDGSEVKKRLFEQFVFEDGMLVEVRQWDAALVED